jgi:hypothetical protein
MRISPIAAGRGGCHSRAVDEATLHRVGSALRKMGEDLVAERRRVMLLTRENEELRAQLAELRRAPAVTEAPAATTVNAAGSGRRP